MRGDRQTVVAEVDGITFRDIVAKVEPRVVLKNVRSEATGALLLTRTELKARTWGVRLRTGDHISFECTLAQVGEEIALRNPRKLELR